MANRPRPLSPHLQIYRWQIQMVVSIINRVTGVILAAGSLLFAYGLVALAAGPERWNDFVGLARSPLGFLILFGWTWALAFHALGGLRHLAQDVGYGFRIEDVIRSSWMTVIGSMLLTALVWVIAMMKWGNA
ncbi:MAG: Succinate dehydrogenase cytochrome b-556 subunit [uncultured Lysobacter sp.]|uniref:Succinate dehydrogenase cytochrome b556 subunit n=1 Tax=uncultured Lysobacter sp. TaxID=271060 RepID=A0A6J4KLX9_9GAMM|nr:MAG: Succinate dehydrogenase cytochrome b-556 subunit [uncultured Lysobacter sp.]